MLNGIIPISEVATTCDPYGWYMITCCSYGLDFTTGLPDCKPSLETAIVSCIADTIQQTGDSLFYSTLPVGSRCIFPLGYHWQEYVILP